MFCWGIQSIGSDFIGIVNPIEEIWTAENIKDPCEELLKHANSYMENNRQNFNSFNRISPQSIVEKVLRHNTMDFIKRYY